MNRKTTIVPSTYIQSPFDLIKAPVDWSIIESKVLIAIVSNLQDRMHRFHQSDVNGQLSLFSDEEFDENGEFKMVINLKDLNINSKHYDQIDPACKRLSSLIVPVLNTDDNGLIVQEYRQLFVAGFNVDINNEQKYIDNMRRESVGETDKTPWKRGVKNNSIQIKINRIVAKSLFLGGNFSLHLRNIAHNCRCSYTPHLYMYLCKFRAFKKEVTIGYEELRKMVGMYKFNSKGEKVKYDEDGNEVIDKTGMYPRFKDFRKRVLDPAKAELSKLYEAGNVDLVFDYSPIYEGGRIEGRGNPISIHFDIECTDDNERTAIVDSMSEKERRAYYQEVDNTPVKIRTVTGSSTGDYQLMKRLASAGNEWAVKALEDAANGKAWDVDEFESQLKDSGIDLS